MRKVLRPNPLFFSLPPIPDNSTRRLRTLKIPLQILRWIGIEKGGADNTMAFLFKDKKNAGKAQDKNAIPNSAAGSKPSPKSSNRGMNENQRMAGSGVTNSRNSLRETRASSQDKLSWMRGPRTEQQVQDSSVGYNS